MSFLNKKAKTAGVVAALMTWAGPCLADQNALLVEQIGDNNRAISYQGTVPTANDVGNALGTTTSTPLFDLFNLLRKGD